MHLNHADFATPEFGDDELALAVPDRLFEYCWRLMKDGKFEVGRFLHRAGFLSTEKKAAMECLRGVVFRAEEELSFLDNEAQQKERASVQRASKQCNKILVDTYFSAFAI
ncbi:hypothetical protein HDU96_001833 [Phlyctochytrium bullatum]|nr:hypothetical protein HDU96_001833 [Phlyctochytrium bullatum]